MFIKKLEIFGFKTFADKTEVDFSHGVTAVVGPNGCGKTNITDALLWVLGESNVRNIRGQKATDVIFNGTDKRKPLNVAEVTLTLDNTCGTLPLSYSEVTITRRAYRSGEADFFINKTRCRLKDIYELFLDTGIGREAYSMVTQGEIDAVLSAKSEDRREIFEEAAGVKKYRYRRQEALRKLEKTEVNLNRVRDIMAEISTQLEPLSEQAQDAKKFSDLQSQLREIEIGLLIRDLRKHSSALDQIREDRKDSSTKLEELENQLLDQEIAKEEQTESLAAVEEDVDNARRLEQNLSSNLQRLTSKSALIEEKIKSAELVKQQADEDILNLELKIKDIQTRMNVLQAEAEESIKSESQAKSKADKETQDLADFDKRHEDASRIINDQKASFLELAKELAAKRNALQNSKNRTVQIQQALDKYAKELQTIEEQKQAIQKRLEEAKTEVEALNNDITQTNTAIAELVSKRKSAEDTRSNLSKQISDNSNNTASRSSRLSTLKEMAESHEGFFEGVRNVMSAAKRNQVQGNFAVVADVINVPKGYETAVETALAASLQDVITDTVDEAKAAIAYLKNNRLGRATFLPLDNMRKNNADVRGASKNESGFLGIASDIIDFDNKYAPAIKTLLGRTIIAENIDDAVFLSSKMDGWNKIVTLDGELMVPSGAITGGSMKSKGPGILLRKQEMETLAADIKKLEKTLKELQQSLSDTETQLANIRTETASAEKKLSDTRVTLAEKRRQADFAQEDIKRLDRQSQTITLENEEAQTLYREENENIAKLELELQTAGMENTDLDRRLADVTKEIEELEKQRQDTRGRLMELNVELAGLTERTSSIKNSLAENQRAYDEAKISLTRRKSQIANVSVDESELSKEKETIENELVSQKSLLTAAQANLKTLLEKRVAQQESLSKLDAEIKSIYTNRNRLAQDSHDADVKEARLEVQVNQSVERLQTEYELSYEEALKWPEDEIEVERGTATEVARLRREIKLMGPVNIGAVQEYERIKERWDFLTAQRADLESASDQINAAIREIDTNTRGLFLETFNAVAGHFDSIFKRLFGGGKTELSLTDPNNLLETGIDVVVQAPGKKLQDLALLSGGERALTATALIFALLAAKPSPFVVMDEVDAPLDESNVIRFAEVLKDFSKNSQFIVVTHNRSTMEAAGSLYGVTMQEPGVSKLISVKLVSEESDTRIGVNL